MLEEERKYEVDAAFVVPDLAAASGCRVVAKSPLTLTATYWDTTDLRLARAGASLRHRKGDPDPWTVKLPADAPGARHEISRSGKSGRVPEELLGLVCSVTRGADLSPVAVVRTVRQAYDVFHTDGRLLAEVADDAVAVIDGRRVRDRFREIEVERKNGNGKVLDRIDAALRDAGAKRGDFVPKHVRALGAAATAEPDLASPGDLPTNPTAGDVVTYAIRRSVGRLLAHDPFVRLREPVGDDDTAVHQMRVACRRLRSDLRTFRSLVQAGWASALRDEVKWLADALGAARDAEVLRSRLHVTATADPLCPVDEAAVARIDAELTARHDAALNDLDRVLRSARYLALVEELVAAARKPKLTRQAEKPAKDVLPGLVGQPWRRLKSGRKGGPGAANLDLAAPDEQWHAVRINGKKARYAADAVSSVLGGGAAKLARSLSRVQNLLGEHQDAAVAGQTWLSIAEGKPADRALAVTAGRLFERERTAIRTARADFPDVWRRASKRSKTGWLA
jgi:CHAD domain-containing protein